MSTLSHPFFDAQKQAVASWQQHSTSKGAWLPVDYMDVMHSQGQQQRFQWLKTQDVCKNWYLGGKLFECFERWKTGYSEMPLRGFFLEVLGDAGIPSFYSKAGLLPSEALQRLSEQLVLVNYTFMKGLAILQAVQNYLGDDKFNRVFEDRALTLVTPCSLLSLFDKKEISSPEEIQEGDWCVFQNVDSYKQKHLVEGDGQWLMLCVGNDRYVGFGPAAAVEMSRQEIEEHMFAAYAKTPRDPSLYSSSGALLDAVEVSESKAPESMEEWKAEAKEQKETFGSLGLVCKKVYRPRLHVLEELQQEKNIERFEQLYKEHCEKKHEYQVSRFAAKLARARNLGDFLKLSDMIEGIIESLKKEAQ